MKDVLLVGQRRIEQAKVRTYWETGQLIQRHLLLHEDRAQYGRQIIPRLAENLGISARVLYHCVQFARTFHAAGTGSRGSQRELHVERLGGASVKRPGYWTIPPRLQISVDLFRWRQKKVNITRRTFVVSG